MQLLKGAGERISGVVAVFDGDIDDFYARVLKIKCGKREASAANVFGQRNSRKERKHTGKMILRAIGQLCCYFEVDLAAEMIFNIVQGCIQVYERVHPSSLLLSQQNSRKASEPSDFSCTDLQGSSAAFFSGKLENLKVEVDSDDQPLLR